MIAQTQFYTQHLIFNGWSGWSLWADYLSKVLAKNMSIVARQHSAFSPNVIISIFSHCLSLTNSMFLRELFSSKTARPSSGWNCRLYLSLFDCLWSLQPNTLFRGFKASVPDEYFPRFRKPLLTLQRHRKCFRRDSNRWLKETESGTLLHGEEQWKSFFTTWSIISSRDSRHIQWGIHISIKRRFWKQDSEN